MKLTAQLKLTPTPEQADALRRTLERANAACDYISRVAWESKTFRQFHIHQLTYKDVRETFGLSAQVVVRCIAKVADAYKLDRQTLRTFTPLGAVAYDSRILTYNASCISLWTLDGRISIPFVCGTRQRQMLATQKGETDLAFVRGEWYLCATCDVAQAARLDPTGALGIDLGIVNLATDSDGETYTGADVDRKRHWYASRRAALQKSGTKSAKRHLKRLAGKQKRYQKDINHILSKRIVAKAERTKRTIAIEDLNGIRERTRARGPQQRARQSNWAFGQLRGFLSYKAQRSGIDVVAVDPRNTSRTCSGCGHCEKANRRSQANFCCVVCHYATSADYNAAINIERAAVNQPMVSTFG